MYLKRIISEIIKKKKASWKDFWGTSSLLCISGMDTSRASSHTEPSQTYIWFVVSFVHFLSLSVTNSCKAQANLECNITRDFANSYQFIKLSKDSAVLKVFG